jgi:anti-anti-sigma regulatory factor
MSTAAEIGSDILTLPSALDPQTLKETFAEMLLTRTDIIVDGAQVVRIGTPAVQVILAAAQTLKSEGRAFVLKQPSNALRSAFVDLGLTSELERWSSP